MCISVTFIAYSSLLVVFVYWCCYLCASLRAIHCLCSGVGGDRCGVSCLYCH